ILDEPTRGVDVGAKGEIYALIHRLAGEGKAIVLISSELPEVVAQSDRVGIFREGRLVSVVDPRAPSPQEIATAALPVPDVGQAASLPVRMPGRRTAPGQSGPHPPRPALRSVRELALALFVVVFFGVLQGVSGRFLQPDGLRSLVTDTALLSFCAIGAAL